METLQGNFLIATPQMPDPRFKKQVILICSHSNEGAMGLVINQPSTYSLQEVISAAQISVDDGERQWPLIYTGGPVETQTAFFIYDSKYQNVSNYVAVHRGICLSRDPEILFDIARGVGPSKYLFILGYAGWAAGQLEAELATNGWLTLPGTSDILFDTPDEIKWKRAAEKFGIDISLFSDEAGNA